MTDCLTRCHQFSCRGRRWTSL